MVGKGGGNASPLAHAYLRVSESLCHQLFQYASHLGRTERVSEASLDEEAGKGS
jgi:hypothetical protein